MLYKLYLERPWCAFIWSGNQFHCLVSVERKKKTLVKKPSRLLGLIKYNFDQQDDENFKIYSNLDLGSSSPSKEKQRFLHDTGIASFFFFFFFVVKQHKDQTQCYLFSPPAHQSGPKLLGIDLLCSRINTLSQSHCYSRDCQRYRAGEQNPALYVLNGVSY